MLSRDVLQIDTKAVAEEISAAIREQVLGKLRKKHHLNLKRVIAMGHSAGGQLALYLGAELPWLRLSTPLLRRRASGTAHGPSACCASTPQW